MTTPEQLKAHKTISYAKSVLRLWGCGIGISGALHSAVIAAVVIAFTFLGVAEFLGIIEETVVE